MVKSFYVTQTNLSTFNLFAFKSLEQCAIIENFSPKFLIFLKFRTLEGTLDTNAPGKSSQNTAIFNTDWLKA